MNEKLGGKAWWTKNQGKPVFANSTKIDDLEASFKSSVKKFKKALDDAGASVYISSTRRSKKRAYVMHYAWKIAKKKIKAKDVPSESGVDIKWDYGDDKKSIAAAQEIVTAANMAHMASLTSNHIKGEAIDWSITWKGDLNIKQQNKKMLTISSTPRNGGYPGNKALHKVGEGYGVKKYKGSGDPPHWSSNGR